MKLFNKYKVEMLLTLLYIALVFLAVYIYQM